MLIYLKKMLGCVCMVGIMTLHAGAAQTAKEGPGTRKYERNILKLSQILGAIHHLREICNANEGQLWRQKMVELLETEAPTPKRRNLLVKGFNQGYRGQQRYYRKCTKRAGRKVLRFVKEGAILADKIAQARENANK